MAAILASLTSIIGRMTEVLAPDIYRAHWSIQSYHCASKWRVLRRDKFQLNYAIVQSISHHLNMQKLLKEQLVSARLVRFKLENILP